MFSQYNVGILEQIIRIILGSFMIAIALTFGPSSLSYYILLLLGVILGITGFFGTCPAYTILHLNTAENR
ncbi:MAG: DUF2892 domain-containing protein [Methanoregula sp.]